MPKVETFNRDIVLEQATNIFHDKGYNATSMQDLVDATGLNRSSIYNSFVNKLSLYLECLKLYENNYKRDASKVLLKANNPLEAIKLIFDLYIQIISDDQYNRGCMVVNCKSEMTNHDKSITAFLENSQSNMLQLLEDLVSKAQQESLVNERQTPKDYALYLYSSLQGFRMTGILITDKKQLKTIANTIIQTLI